MKTLFGEIPHPSRVEELDDYALYRAGRVAGIHNSYSDEFTNGQLLDIPPSIEEVSSSKRLIDLWLKCVHKLPTKRRKIFWQGYANAHSKCIVDDQGRLVKQTNSTRMKVFILKNWDAVLKCKNDEELHNFLVKSLGAEFVSPSWQATAKMRQRMGIKLAPPGRPRKSPR